MKKQSIQFILLLSCWSVVSIALAQSVLIDPKANTLPIVDIKSTNGNGGVAMPRMTVAQRNVIALQVGLQVYCTDCTPAGPYSYDGGSWVAMFQTQTVSPITYTVGQAAQGGMVFWVDPASGGQHGLVVDKYDIMNGGCWDWPNSYSSFTPYCGAHAFGYYGGEFNTARMLDKQDEGYFYAPAQACRAFGGGENSITKFSYGDWYVPSVGELNLLYTLRNTIGNFDTGKKYWSSTESSPTLSYYVNFANGISNTLDKATYCAARCIRRF
ncbi:hypothetical protein [Runella sp.]|uniref:hypothetical protein n=1 Tax=Runella sp. TaxID=1960881 RepID=UPI003D132AC8